MTNTKVNNPPLGEVENYFGGCPVCGKTDGCVVTSFPCCGTDTWFVCNAHKCKWEPRERQTGPPPNDWFCENVVLQDIRTNNYHDYVWTTPIRLLRDRHHGLPKEDGPEW